MTSKKQEGWRKKREEKGKGAMEEKFCREREMKEDKRRGCERERVERERGEEEEREAFPLASPHDGISIARRCEERVRRCREREKERLLEGEMRGGEKRSSPCGSLATEVIFVARRREEREVIGSKSSCV